MTKISNATLPSVGGPALTGKRQPLRATLTNSAGNTQSVATDDAYYGPVMLRAVVEGTRIPVHSTVLKSAGGDWGQWTFVAVALDAVTVRGYEDADALGRNDSWYLYVPTPRHLGDAALNGYRLQAVALASRLRGQDGRCPALGILQSYLRAMMGEVRVAAQPIPMSVNDIAIWAHAVGGYDQSIDH